VFTAEKIPAYTIMLNSRRNVFNESAECTADMLGNTFNMHKQQNSVLRLMSAFLATLPFYAARSSRTFSIGSDSSGVYMDNTLTCN